MVVYREMNKRDAAAAAELEKQCFHVPWSKGAILSDLRQNVSAYQVCLEEESEGERRLLFDGDTKKLLGYGGMWVLFEEAHVTRLAVDPEHRRQGIAKELMLRLMEEALTMSASAMTLEVREHNEAAIRLYESLGFAKQGMRPRYYEDTGEAALILWNMDIAKTVASMRQK